MAKECAPMCCRRQMSMVVDGCEKDKEKEENKEKSI